MNAQSPAQVQVWFTAAEIAERAAAGDMPGLPETKRGVNDLAERENWQRYHALVKTETGVGGTITRYHLDLLPLDVRLCYLSRRIGPALALKGGTAPVGSQEPDEMHGAGDLTDRARLTRDARMTILRMADRFRQMLDLGALGTDALFADMYNAGRVPMPDWAEGVVKRVSARTLMRWRQARASAGSAALGHDPAQARKGKGVLDTANDGAVRTFIFALVAQQPHLSADHVRTLCRSEFGDTITIDRRGRRVTVAMPPVRTFQHFIKGLKATEKVALTKLSNPDKYRSAMAPAGVGALRHIREPNALWQIDASPVDALCTDGRHAIYACIDIATRRTLFYVSKTPRASAVAMLLRRAILAWGVPDVIKTDNGSDFVAKDTRRLFDSLGITMDVSDAYSPQQKGHVERVIKTFQHDCSTLFPGFVGHNPADRKTIEDRKSFSDRLGADAAELFGVSMTGPELQRHADEWAEVRYQHRPHAGLKGKTPAQAAAASATTIRTVDARALDMLLMPVAGKDGLRTVTKRGIRIGEFYYGLNGALPGDRLFVRMDPNDAGRAVAFDAGDGSYLGDAVCPDLAGIHPSTLLAARREAQAEVVEASTRDVRKKIREITRGPALIERVLDVARRDLPNVVPLPKREVEHTTPAIAAALDAARPAEAPAQPKRAAELLDEMRKEMAAPAASAPGTATPTVTPLRRQETPQIRFRRALDLMDRLAAGEDITTDEALWLGGYRDGAEFRALMALHEDFGR
jgi:transposase InsO family protein